MAKEDVKIESSTKDFKNYNEKIIKLKNKIEEEINNINILYEKTIKDLTESFKIKYEKLKKEENDIKEKLDNEVTKVKEKLENYLSQTNNLININEKINKGIEKLEKNEKNMIKTLSYISKINKNKKQMELLLSELIKTMKFSYNEEESKIKYEVLYFNEFNVFPELPIPKNIKFDDITDTEIKISWEYDKININNIDFNKIKYIVEMRKEKEKFNEVYKGENTFCLINNLVKNTNYEFRICLFYNDLNGPWTKVFNAKTLNFESIILKESKKMYLFTKKILEWSGYKDMELIYRATRDGTTCQNFHSKCDNQGPTIVLFKNEKGYIYGGYAAITWKSSHSWNNTPESFIFTLTNINNTEPTKFPRNNNQYGIYDSKSTGPWFGNSGNIGFDHNLNEGYSRFPSDYQDTLGKGKSIFTGNLDNNTDKIILKEVEAFKLFK